jgi:cytoplasmic tRNA 2-thiolation protein 1
MRKVPDSIGFISGSGSIRSKELPETSPSCTKCGRRPSIYYRPYSGERLCGPCFKESLRERVERTISKYDMLRFDSKVAVGVSGGKDSLGLLHMLNEIEEQYPRSELVAVSIDEGVEGYRDEAIAIATEACQHLGVEHHVLSFHDLFGVTMDGIASEPRELSPCSYCGVLRRRALNVAARRVGADRLATAHNLDDMAQTALLNVLRGDINRLALMHPGGSELPGFVKRVKPFCEVPERESTLYAYLMGFRFQELPCPYAPQAMRNDVRGFLNRMEEKRPGTKFIVYNTALKVIPQRKLITVANICQKCGEPTSNDICRVCQIVEEVTKEEKFDY